MAPSFAALVLPLLFPSVQGTEGNALTHGPILGRPSSDSMAVWIRTRRPGAFEVVAEGGHRVEARGRTRAADDVTGVAVLEGLRPGTRYRYTVMLVNGSGPGRGGSFRTLPAPEERRSEDNPRGLFDFTFEHGSCNFQFDRGGDVGHDMPAYRTLVERHLDEADFHVFSGDFIYEARRGTAPAAWQRSHSLAALPPGVDVLPGVVGVWANYRLYLERAPSLAAWHRHVPSVFMFDDHELLNDINGTADPGPASRRTLFRDVGVVAWRDYLGWANPPGPGPRTVRFGRAAVEAGGDVLADPDGGFAGLDPGTCPTLHVHPEAGDVAGVYEVVEVVDGGHLRVRPDFPASAEAAPYTLGARNEFEFRVANAHFFVLDVRGMRQRHDPDRPDREGVSMLGRAQRQWLVGGIRRSDADFLFVVTPVSFAIPHVSPRKPDKDESWTAYLDERERLLEVFEEAGRPVFVLAGDLHNSIATRVTPNVHEFVCGPHNSPNHRAVEEGGRPPNGPFSWAGRTVDILWSSHWPAGTPRRAMRQPFYTLVEVHNARRVPGPEGEVRWVAFPRPFVTFRVHDGRTGEQVFAHTVHAAPR